MCRHTQQAKVEEQLSTKSVALTCTGGMVKRLTRKNVFNRPVVKSLRQFVFLNVRKTSCAMNGTSRAKTSGSKVVELSRAPHSTNITVEEPFIDAHTVGLVRNLFPQTTTIINMRRPEHRIRFGVTGIFKPGSGRGLAVKGDAVSTFHATHTGRRESHFVVRDSSYDM